MLAAVHFGELTAPEQRVLGCLIEKRWTTPEQYPLSLNALRLACNQSTNRDPVTNYDETTVRDAAQRLSRYGLARLASGHNSRAIKYRHLAEEALGLGREELAVLAVLLLRGPQTPGELKQRTERMSGAWPRCRTSIACSRRSASAATPAGSRRRPGQKEDRFEHLLGGGGDARRLASRRRRARRPEPEPSSPAPRSPPSRSVPRPPVPAAPRVEFSRSSDGDLAGLEAEGGRARLDELQAR